MTDAIEAGARELRIGLINLGVNLEADVCAKLFEAAIASGALVPASAELSGISGELRDRIAEAIRGDGSDLCDTPWITLSDEMKLGWRGDADRVLAVIKDYLTTEIASAVAEMRERCRKEARNAILNLSREAASSNGGGGHFEARRHISTRPRSEG